MPRSKKLFLFRVILHHRPRLTRLTLYPALQGRAVLYQELILAFLQSLSICAGNVSYRLPRCKMPCLACLARLSRLCYSFQRLYTHTLYTLGACVIAYEPLHDAVKRHARLLALLALLVMLPNAPRAD